MAAAEVYPLTFAPVFKDYTWGGRNLATKLGRTLPDGIVAESWEIAAHPNGSSTVAAGALAGQTLVEAMAQWGEALVGSRNHYGLAHGRFPLLIKLLDAQRWLSVQVHPDDDYALVHAGDFGKTEMWVVLAAEPGAELIYGFRPGVTRDRFAAAIAAGETEAWLHRVSVRHGDVIFVPAGAIHALGPGIIVAEIQQNSDTTYRIYDWGRPRPIHVAQALDVLDFSLVEPQPLTPIPVADASLPTEVIGECRYFRTERITTTAGAALPGRCDGATFEIWGVLDGGLVLEWRGAPVTIDAVGWVLIPAGLGDFEVRTSTPSTLLRVLTPESAAHG
jgi:mannose-6-phosphate isomerase